MSYDNEVGVGKFRSYHNYGNVSAQRMNTPDPFMYCSCHVCNNVNNPQTRRLCQSWQCFYLTSQGDNRTLSLPSSSLS